MPWQRNAATKVNVFESPYGTLAITRCPRFASALGDLRRLLSGTPAAAPGLEKDGLAQDRLDFLAETCEIDGERFKFRLMTIRLIASLPLGLLPPAVVPA
jgi:hypothetical protein